MDVEILKTLILNTFVLSFLYILSALGFAFIFNMMGAINISHGVIYMISAYVCYYAMEWLGVGNWLGLIIAIAIVSLLGLLMERTVFRPFMSELNRTIMISVALISLLQTIVANTTGSREQIIPSFALGRSNIFGLTVSNEKLLITAIGFTLLVAVLFIVNRTTLGRQMEAIAQDRTASALQGIKLNKVAAIVCAIGFALAAVSGGMMGSLQRITSTMGDNMQVRILMVVMLAGAGSKSMNGLIITGFILGAIDSTLPVFMIGTTAQAITGFVVLVLMLIRPTGFFGHEM